ncbi:MAG: L-alanine exporter AlaE [archaeon]
MTLTKLLNWEAAKKFGKRAARGIYSASVNAFAQNSFGYALMAPIELGIAGMSWSEHLWTRAAVFLPNCITATPYTWYRNWIFKKMNVGEQGLEKLALEVADKCGFNMGYQVYLLGTPEVKKYVGDTIACASFQVPIYYAITRGIGVDSAEANKSVISQILFNGAIGRPYGAYLDKVRKTCGLDKR